MAEELKEISDRVQINTDSIKEIQSFQQHALMPRLKKLDEVHEVMTGNGNPQKGALYRLGKVEDIIETSVERRKETRKIVKERIAYIVTIFVVMFIASLSSKIWELVLGK